MYILKAKIQHVQFGWGRKLSDTLINIVDFIGVRIVPGCEEAFVKYLLAQEIYQLTQSSDSCVQDGLNCTTDSSILIGKMYNQHIFLWGIWVDQLVMHGFRSDSHGFKARLYQFRQKYFSF